MDHILVVDDEGRLRLTLAPFLTGAGYEVETAEDVATALNRQA